MGRETHEPAAASCSRTPTPSRPPTRCSTRCTPATSPPFRCGCRRGCAPCRTASATRSGMAAGGMVLLLAPPSPERSTRCTCHADRDDRPRCCSSPSGVFTGIMIDAVAADGPGADHRGRRRRRAGPSCAPRAARWRPGSAGRGCATVCCPARADAAGPTGRRAPGRARGPPRPAPGLRPGAALRPGRAVGQLEVLLDSRSPELRALVVEAVLSLPVRRLFLPFLPALRRRYLP